MGICIGPSAMQRLGLAAWYDGMLMQTTKLPHRNDTQVGNSMLFYIPELDQDGEYIERTFKTMWGTMRLPTQERALVDYMRHLDVLEDFYFLEGLHEYLEYNGPTKLLEVAEHYGVRDEMQKWIDDDVNYTNWG